MFCTALLEPMVLSAKKDFFFSKKVKHKETFEIHFKRAQNKSLGQDPISASSDLILAIKGLSISQ